MGTSRGLRGGADVLVCDAEQVYAEGLRLTIARAPSLSWGGWAPTVAEARRRHASLRSRVVCLDARLDPLLAFAGELVDGGDCTVVLLVAGQRQAGLLHRAAKAGVQACLSRTVTAQQFVSGVRAAAWHGHYRDPALTASISHESGTGRAPAVPWLSHREVQVLTQLAQGWDNLTIAAQLGVSRETVRTHVKGILRKLDVHDRATAVALAFRCGLLTPEDIGDPADQEAAAAVTNWRTRHGDSIESA